MFIVFDAESKKTIASAFGTKKQYSAMVPMLWIIGICGTICICIMHARFVSEWIKVVFVSVFCLVVFIAIGVFIYFAVKKPEYLRSEKYHATHDVLSFCERMQANPDKVVRALASTANPMLEDKTQ